MKNYRKIQMAAVAAAVMIALATMSGTSNAATRKVTANTRTTSSAFSALKNNVSNALVGVRYYLWGEDEGFPSKAPSRKLPRMSL